MVTKLSSIVPRMIVITITAGRNAAAPRPAMVVAIAAVTPSRVSAHEKIIAALTVKKIMPFKSDALVRIDHKLRALTFR